MAILSVYGINFSVGVKQILTDVTFSAEAGDRVGIVGTNGCGKSTLLRIITGEYTADSGSVTVPKECSIGMMRQDDDFLISDEGADGSVLGQMYAAFPKLLRWEKRLAELEEELKIAEGDELIRLTNEFTSVNSSFIEGGGLQYKSRTKSILAALGFSEDYHSLPADSLSGGQRTRLALARLLLREPDILILDEPTNHLDEDTMEWLENRLASYKGTLLTVSHDRYFLDRVTNKTLDMEHGRAKLYRCAYTEYTAKRDADREAEMKKYELQQKEIARLEAFIENQRKWNRERNIIAAESRMKAIDRMEKVDRPMDDPRAIRFTFSEGRESGNDVLSVRSLAMEFGEKKLFQGLSFEVKKRERIFIAGPNGCGKSTLLKLLLGKLMPTGGVIEWGYNVNQGYYDQENQNLDPDSTVLDELWNAYPGISQKELRGALALFCFRGDDIEKTVSVLSGGERSRLTMAKLMLSEMNVLILDEPTNHLDIRSREALEDALLAYDGTLIAVSHDRYFMKKLATRVIMLGDNGCVNCIGGYEDYREKKDGAAANGEQPESAASLEVSDAKEAYLRRKQDAAELRKKRARLRAVHSEIEKLEVTLADITDELFGPAATDYIKAAELADEKTVTEDRLMQLYEEEEALESELAEE